MAPAQDMAINWASIMTSSEPKTGARNTLAPTTSTQVRATIRKMAPKPIHSIHPQIRRLNLSNFSSINFCLAIVPDLPPPCREEEVRG